MSDNSSSIHDKKCDFSSEDEGISASGLFVNQKSILNNFHLHHKFTFGKQKQDEEMAEDDGNGDGNGDEGNNNLQGDEDDNNGYSSQEVGRPSH